ncbi:hypothetical protein P9112_008590 [Eukaryota sp. TZLM1-RC]
MVSEKEVRLLTRRLAHTEKTTRDQAFEDLKNLLQSEPLEDLYFKRVLHGLFYCIWHSDKPLVQASLSERVSSCIQMLNEDQAVRFFTFLLTELGRQWGNIDNLRLDKFLYLIRLLLRRAMTCSLSNSDYAESFGESLTTMMSDEKILPFGLQSHICDVLPEEVFEVFGQAPPPNACLPFLYSVVVAMCKTKNKYLRNCHKLALSDIITSLLPADDEESSPNVVLLMSFSEIAFFHASSSPDTTPQARKMLYELADVICKHLDTPLGSLSKVPTNVEESDQSNDDDDSQSTDQESDLDVIDSDGDSDSSQEEGSLLLMSNVRKMQSSQKQSTQTPKKKKRRI